MKFTLFLVPLLIASCASNPHANRKIASEQTLPVKSSFSSTDNSLKDDGVFPIIASLSFIMSNLDIGGVGKSLIKVNFPTNNMAIKEVKLKRVVLFADRMDSQERLRSFLQKMMGDKLVSLKFINELSIRLEPSPLLEGERTSFVEATNKDLLKHKEGALLRYDSKVNTGNPLSKVYLFKTKDTEGTKKFIDEVISDRSLKNIEIVDDVVFVELKNDNLIEQSFRATMSNYSEKLEVLGVNAIDQCSKETCIDFEVSDENLAPLFKQSEALTMEALLKSKNIMDNFKLKGFIEFELKLNADF